MFAKFAAAGAVFASAVLFASTASATLIHDYELNGNLHDSAGGADIVSNGGTLGASGVTFGANQGLAIGGYSNTGVYTIATRFDFDQTTGYRKILDFKDLASDNGLYNLNTALVFYNDAFGAVGAINPGTLVDVVLTRNSGGVTTGYINGVEAIQYTDGIGDSVIQDTLNLFVDDHVTGQGEASSGFVDYVRTYDTALNADQVRLLTDAPPVIGPGVPEPGAWAMMILGLGGVGALLRRRRQQPALA
ncbi:MAG TPA: PEPxxWA-CTERM sorting domain-containing protein [Phenylobacterium sp.]|jgi:hypothetical protein|uniref:PEPxxWA-CTERM sorting domain-containing protein n=1 Tax=Phenylobacterium sp. TaxID=1871053 RepID=UPI002C28A564|nr:PEPxxWA-CTERM sorting domain-containing protein [Phenylobacterium sp.]HXA39673.1 PEPxxWA-CTERM sorting domain-containing protein [Phenylobacterium sp.]